MADRTHLAVGRGLLDEDPVVDQFFLHPAAVSLEHAVLEVLAELKVDVFHAVAVLLDAPAHPVMELLGVCPSCT